MKCTYCLCCSCPAVIGTICHCPLKRESFKETLDKSEIDECDNFTPLTTAEKYDTI